jgi:hypothetical protein
MSNPFCCAEEQLYGASTSSSFGKPEIRHLIDIFYSWWRAYRGAIKAAINLFFRAAMPTCSIADAKIATVDVVADQGRLRELELSVLGE